MICRLEHYTEYIIKVRACNDGLKVVRNNEKEFCGDSEIASGRTKKDQQADKITKLTTEVIPNDEALKPVRRGFCLFVSSQSRIVHNNSLSDSLITVGFDSIKLLII